jgi:hypothetical protein
MNKIERFRITTEKAEQFRRKKNTLAAIGEVCHSDCNHIIIVIARNINLVCARKTSSNHSIAYKFSFSFQISTNKTLRHAASIQIHHRRP